MLGNIQGSFMTDSLHKLLFDTLTYLKDPLHPKETLFSSEEEKRWFTPKVSAKTQRREEVSEFTPVLAPKSENPPSETNHTKQVATKSLQPDPHTFSQLKNTLQKIAPSIRLVEEVPDDKEGKKKSNAWKEKVEGAEVVLLACSSDPETLELLKSLAKAIQGHLAKVKILPAERLEQEDHWEAFLEKNALRLIVISHGLEKLHNLNRFYKKTQEGFFLGPTPLLPLSAASVYKQLPSKASLWKTLCQMLRK